MQRIANLLAVQDGKVLLLQKPRRGWFVAPGGKMESGESIYEAAIREFHEETNATPKNVHLKGIFTMVIKENDEVVDEWMLYTFVSHGIEGTPFEQTREGKLAWHSIESLHSLPMAEGDRTNLLFAALNEGIQYGTFEYTEDFELLSKRIQTSNEH
ncbi:NUDIX hydrolase [Ureibacillus massiliensis 4400831 = CIP 108448 = CCUG 49529]|uniref:NUDIX hydrolase n=2 Tax=cellular organisms TaxID=131567 RepID=A0A0A3J194_9BACL|nr:8-oxo-dGTP diphosphatase [Ureibacillus massiliensis]KGR90764.1 NUDIX hydrolase [Ureibacillus massiliensis 4400831 = CIP 108448 = CCUG 49529]BDH62916.1 putative Nudix hydrolase YvcI [Lysinibacillus sp. PLM2]